MRGGFCNQSLFLTRPINKTKGSPGLAVVICFSRIAIFLDCMIKTRRFVWFSDAQHTESTYQIISAYFVSDFLTGSDKSARAIPERVIRY